MRARCVLASRYYIFSRAWGLAAQHRRRFTFCCTKCQVDFWHCHGLAGIQTQTQDPGPGRCRRVPVQFWTVHDEAPLGPGSLLFRNSRRQASIHRHKALLTMLIIRPLQPFCTELNPRAFRLSSLWIRINWTFVSFYSAPNRA